MRTNVHFGKLYPNPAYDGPQPVYVAHFPWAGAVGCFVRRSGKVWETAELTTYVHKATFTACPVADASATRYAAVVAFDYFHNTSRSH